MMFDCVCLVVIWFILIDCVINGCLLRYCLLVCVFLSLFV